MSSYPIRVLIALDQLANALRGGEPDETISAWLYRIKSVRRQAFVNWLFRNPNHCKNSYESELRRSQLPEAYR